MFTRKAKSKSQHTLMQALKFTEADLQANREGRLSEAQVERLKTKEITDANVALAALVLMVVVIPLVCGCSLIAALVSGSTFGEDPQEILALCFLGTVAAILIMSGAVGSDDYLRDINEPRVKVIEGPVSLRGGFVHISGLRLLPTGYAFDAFEKGVHYRIYYTPHSKILLSAEWPYEDYFD